MSHVHDSFPHSLPCSCLVSTLTIQVSWYPLHVFCLVLVKLHVETCYDPLCHGEAMLDPTPRRLTWSHHSARILCTLHPNRYTQISVSAFHELFKNCFPKAILEVRSTMAMLNQATSINADHLHHHISSILWKLDCVSRATNVEHQFVCITLEASDD